jgi:exodeoxyribonuclease VII small subunit
MCDPGLTVRLHPGISGRKPLVGRTPARLPVIYGRPENSVNMVSRRIGHRLRQFQTELSAQAGNQTGNRIVAGRKSQQEPADEEGPTFEGSIVELQDIVGQLEDGSLPLEDSMQQFERGISLLRNCYQVLEQAEQRIEVLTGVAEDGTVETKSFDASSTFDSQSAKGKAASGESKSSDEGTSDGDKPATGKSKSKARRGPTSDESLF